MDETLSRRLGIDVQCPLSSLLYGGMPTGGGFESYTEYEIGVQRVAEACHCILGSLGSLARVTHGEGPAWSLWLEELPYEQDHILEEIGIVTKCMTEYARPLYAQKINNPPEGYDEWVRKTVYSMRRKGPRLSGLARRRQSELVACAGIPGPVLEAAQAAYTVLMVLGRAAEEAVARWPQQPVSSPYGDMILGAAVWKLERTVAALLGHLR